MWVDKLMKDFLRTSGDKSVSSNKDDWALLKPYADVVSMWPIGLGKDKPLFTRFKDGMLMKMKDTTPEGRMLPKLTLKYFFWREFRGPVAWWDLDVGIR